MINAGNLYLGPSGDTKAMGFSRKHETENSSTAFSSRELGLHKSYFYFYNIDRQTDFYQNKAQCCQHPDSKDAAPHPQ